MNRNIALTVIFVVASLGLSSAQSPTPLPPRNTICPFPPPKCSSLTPASNLYDGFKDAIACEWLDANAAPLLNSALEKYIENGDTNQLLSTLKDTVHDNALSDLYDTAFGSPDENGRRAAKSLPDIRDILATANTCKEQLVQEDRNNLFLRAETIINDISKSPGGMAKLNKIDDLFSSWDKYQAFSKLLSALTNSHDQNYVENLEVLRCAFQHDWAKLAKTVSVKISPPKTTPKN